MNNANNSEFSAGNGRFALILLLLLGCILGAWLLFHPKSPIRPYQTFLVKFPEVGTLRTDSPVQLLGIKKGHVAKTELLEDGVLVHVKVDRMVRIPRDSRFRVVNTGLLGQREVEVRLGRSSEFLRNGDTLRGGYDMGSTRLVYMADYLLKSADSMLTSALAVWDSTLGDPEKQARISKIQRNAKTTLGKLDRGIEDWGDSLRILQRDVRSALGKLKAIKTEIEPGVIATVSELKALDGALMGLMEKSDRLSGQVEWFSGRLGSKDNSAGLLLGDENFQGTAKSIVQMLRDLLSDIRRKGLDLNVDLF